MKMMRRTRIAAATVLAGIGLIAATAAPASAAGSALFRTTQTCISEFSGTTVSATAVNVGYPAFLNGVPRGCVPGTLRTSVERIG
jgi:hypothetical protein